MPASPPWGPPNGPRPSATVLLCSLAQVLGEAAVGVLLTGMGEDGVQGLLDLQRRGALTIAQDQATSTIYGMTQEAARLGGALRVLHVLSPVPHTEVARPAAAEPRDR